MLLTAYVRDKQTKQTTVIERDYSSKEKFAKDLRANGYSVIRVSNKRDVFIQEMGDYVSFAELRKAARFFSDARDLLAKVQQMEF